MFHEFMPNSPASRQDYGFFLDVNLLLPQRHQIYLDHGRAAEKKPPGTGYPPAQPTTRRIPHTHGSHSGKYGQLTLR